MIYLFKTFLVIAVFLFLARNVQNWYFYEDCEECRNLTEENETECIDEVEDQVSNHLSDECCNFRAEKVINPYENFTYFDGKRTEQLSACLQCTLCLAVADEIENVMVEFYYENNDKKGHPKQEEDCLKDSLQDLCKNGFKNYDLRKHQGLIFIGKINADSTHVPTSFDGKWRSLLKRKCSFYVNNFNSFQLYNSFKNNEFNITDYLCRGKGIFRECNNIPINILSFEDDDEGDQKCCAMCQI